MELTIPGSSGAYSCFCMSYTDPPPRQELTPILHNAISQDGTYIVCHTGIIFTFVLSVILDSVT